MRRRFALATIVAVLAVALAGVFVLPSATPISAQQIMDQAYSSQVATSAGKGIVHTQTENYQNLAAINALFSTGNADVTAPKVAPGEVKTISDSYLDLQTARQREVVTDATTGKLVSVSALDGTYVYDGSEVAADGRLTVCRSQQPGATKALQPQLAGAYSSDAQAAFEQARQDPSARLVRQESWVDGRQVYVVQYDRTRGVTEEQADRLGPKKDIVSTLYFDASTYELLENRHAIQRDGEEILIGYSRQLLREVLSGDSPVAWDLSDVKGIVIADDPEAEHTDRFMEPVSKNEMAARGGSAYVLETVPDGFDVQLTAPAKPAPGEEHVYMAEYRNDSGDYVVIQGGAIVPSAVLSQATDEYTTASGLKLHFQREETIPGDGGKVSSVAIVVAPDGTTFNFSCNLPLEQIKALAEDLVPIQ